MNKIDAKNLIRRNRILRALLDHGDLSISDIARETGMTLPMVIGLVHMLKKEGYVRNVIGGEEDKVGRPPIIVSLNGNAGFVLGIDIGHLNTNIVLLNLRQKIIADLHKTSTVLADNASAVETLTAVVNEIEQHAGISHEKLLGIGISIPGIVRGRQGRSETYLNFGKKPIREILQECWQKPVAIEHDAKAMALAERWFGAARNVNNALCLNIGWGLGLGMILDGKIFYGRDGYAGEFGHISVPGNTRLCQCGKRGCLETVASGRAIAEFARERIKDYAGSLLVTRGTIDTIDAERVVRAALDGDQFSISIVEEAGGWLGEGIAKLINLFNPEMIILGGRVSGAGQLLLEAVCKTAHRHTLPQLHRGVEFRISELGANAGALGVAMLAARDIFEIDHLNPSALL